MGAMNKIGGDKKAIEGPFDAFKFPTSETVQFRALVTPCLPTCEPVLCNVRSFDGSSREMDSFGRRRRRRRSIAAQDEEEILVAKAIQIKDKFAFNGKDKQQRKNGGNGVSQQRSSGLDGPFSREDGKFFLAIIPINSSSDSVCRWSRWRVGS